MAACTSSARAVARPKTAAHSASAPSTPPAAISRACSWSAARLSLSRFMKRHKTWPQPSATAARPKPHSAAPKAGSGPWTPSMNTPQPTSWASTGARSWRASTAGSSSHFGPAVNRKPAKNRGMKPKLITRPWATAGATVQASGRPWLCATRARHHHSALKASIAAAAPKASRCGAASSRPRRQCSAFSGAGERGPRTMACISVAQACRRRAMPGDSHRR